MEKNLERVREDIFRAVKENSLKETELSRLMNLESDALQPILDDMVKQGEIYRTKKQHYTTLEAMGLVTGRFVGNARGFGFLVMEDREDCFVPPPAKNGALHGDRVLARIEKVGEKFEAEIVDILERGMPRVLGLTRKVGNRIEVTPEERKLGLRIVMEKDIAADQLVLVDIVRYPDPKDRDGVAIGKFVQLLGDARDAQTPIRVAVHAHRLRDVFPPPVIEQSEAIPLELDGAEIVQREDLRGVTICTIDGADAKDFDDAISISEHEAGGWELGVHIADVSYYVRPGTPLDDEAYQRATSVYMSGCVIPMLPERLSNGVCSLRPDEDRFTLSCIMHIDANGHLQGYRIARTVIRSSARLVYEEVNRFYEGEPEMVAKMGHLSDMLGQMAKLHAVLAKFRRQRGALDLDVPEAKIVLDEEGHVADIVMRDRGTAERMIESFMLSANEAVAEHLKKQKIPALYRVHEQPDAERIVSLSKFLAFYGRSLRGVPPSGVLADLLDDVAGKPEAQAISSQVLRSLAKARYDIVPLGHYGLAATDYCHFTSPIRRYPDLVVHRALTTEPAVWKKLSKKLPEMGEHTSLREQEAMHAEWDVAEARKAEYMVSRVGEEYEARVSSVARFGLFIALDNTVEGLIPLQALPDYFVYDEEKNILVGRHTRKVWRIGEKLRVRVESVDLQARSVTFALVDDAPKQKQRPISVSETPKASNRFVRR